MSKWENRIVDYDVVDPEQLLANESNWRVHPRHQQEVLEGTLSEIGWIQDVIVNKRTSEQWPANQRNIETLIDGHLRVKLALRREEKQVPVKYVDLTPRQEKIALATLDPISALATTDKDMLEDVLRETSSTDKAVLGFLAEMAEREGITAPDFQPVDESTQPRLDQKKPVTCPECGNTF